MKRFSVVTPLQSANDAPESADPSARIPGPPVTGAHADDALHDAYSRTVSRVARLARHCAIAAALGARARLAGSHGAACARGCGGLGCRECGTACGRLDHRRAGQARVATFRSLALAGWQRRRSGAAIEDPAPARRHPRSPACAGDADRPLNSPTVALAPHPAPSLWKRTRLSFGTSYCTASYVTRFLPLNGRAQIPATVGSLPQQNGIHGMPPIRHAVPVTQTQPEHRRRPRVGSHPLAAARRRASV